MSALALWDHQHLLIQWPVVVGAAAIAALTDLRSRRIPNLLTFPLLIAGLAFATAVGGLPALGESALACLVLTFPFVILFLFAGGGAGDAKMMGAIGAWLGLGGGIVALLCVTVAGIVLAVGYAIARRRVRSVVGNLTGIATGVVLVAMRHAGMDDVPRVQSVDSMETVPYGIAIFVGTVGAAMGVLLWHA